VSTESLKLKGSVREIGIMRDTDKFDTFNITFGIVIRNDIKINYEEAERLSSKFRKDYLGKEVEFLAVNIPCPICNKILNSQISLKRHILKQHPEKIELIYPPKIEAKQEIIEKPIKKQSKKDDQAKKIVKTQNKPKNNKNQSGKKLDNKKIDEKTIKKQNKSQKKDNSPKLKKQRTVTKASKQQKLAY